MKTKPTLRIVALAALLLNSSNFLLSTAHAQGTAFTYQGQLYSGTNLANGKYDFQFALSNAPSGGSQIGSTLTIPTVGVTNGLFTTILDFGPVYTGQSNWLGISVRSNGLGSYLPLSPLQQLTPTPYAVYAESANASNLVGTVAAANLPANAALLGANQTFTGINDFSASVGIGTTSPSTRLDIVGTGTSDDARLLVETTGGTLGPQLRLKRGGSDGDEWVFVTDGLANGPLDALQFVQSSAGTRLMIATNGNVGIGTTTPATTLQVAGTVGIGTTVNSSAELSIGQPGGLTQFELLKPGSNLGYQFATESGGLDICEHNIACGRLYIQNATGNVGIGTTTPSSLLTVNGSGSPSISLIGSGTNGQLDFGIAGFATAYSVSAVANDAVIRQSGNGNLFLQTGSGAAAIAITTNNNVGIGNSTPETLMQVGNYGLGTNAYLTVSTAGGNLYDAGIKLRHFNSGFGWTLDSDERDSSFRLYSHFSDTNGIVRIWVDRFSGSVGIGKTNPATLLDVNGEITCTAINLTSDRNAKQDFKALNPRDVLAKVAALPITEWQYKAEKDKDSSAARHIGPMAQDFSAAFALGHDEKHISVIDEGGVALAAIQGLNEKLEEQAREKDARIRDLEQSVSELKTLVNRLAVRQSEISR